MNLVTHNVCFVHYIECLIGWVDCVGMTKETEIEGPLKKMTRYCPDKEWKPEMPKEEKDSGNYMRFKGVGTNKLTIDFWEKF